MKVTLKASSTRVPRRIAEVATFGEASAVVRDYISAYDLGSGASHYVSFTGGNVYGDDGKTQIGHISYNGRAWGMDGHEVAL